MWFGQCESLQFQDRLRSKTPAPFLYICINLTEPECTDFEVFVDIMSIGKQVMCKKVDQRSAMAGDITGTWEYYYGGEDSIRLTFSEKEGERAVLCESFDDGDYQKRFSNYIYKNGILRISKPGRDRCIKVAVLSASALVLTNWPEEGNCIFYKQ